MVVDVRLAPKAGAWVKRRNAGKPKGQRRAKARPMLAAARRVCRCSQSSATSRLTGRLAYRLGRAAASAFLQQPSQLPHLPGRCRFSGFDGDDDDGNHRMKTPAGQRAGCVSRCRHRICCCWLFMHLLDLPIPVRRPAAPAMARRRQLVLLRLLSSPVWHANRVLQTTARQWWADGVPPTLARHGRRGWR